MLAGEVNARGSVAAQVTRKDTGRRSCTGGPGSGHRGTRMQLVEAKPVKWEGHEARSLAKLEVSSERPFGTPGGTLMFVLHPHPPSLTMEGGDATRKPT